MKIRGLALLSGGLDSLLAVKLLQEQDIEVTGVCFVSYFFSCVAAEKAAKVLKITLRKIDFSEDHLAIVRKPRYGYGKHMNPCIDCHLLMIKRAGEMMREDGFDFIATGEVLGERPMSQNKRALDLIEKESGLKGYLLRPLSAKLLNPTIAEKQGLVKREKLLDFSGRGRKTQMALAKQWQIKEYPTPAGGCLLTDLNFSLRLKELFARWTDLEKSDFALLKIGRHFWVENNLIVVGRDKEENKTIRELACQGDVLIEPRKFPGPTILVRAKDNILEQSLLKAKELMMMYSKKKDSWRI